MRTTIAIDDDLLATLKQYAEDRSISLGRAISDVLRRALSADCPTVTVNGVTVLDPGPRSPMVSAATVRQLIDDDE